VKDGTGLNTFSALMEEKDPLKQAERRRSEWVGLPLGTVVALEFDDSWNHLLCFGHYFPVCFFNNSFLFYLLLYLIDLTNIYKECPWHLCFPYPRCVEFLSLNDRIK